MNIDWSKAPEGATHAHPPSGDWYRMVGGSWKCFAARAGVWVQALWVEERLPMFVVRPEQQQPWDGTGLPPVGTVCEAVLGGSWQKGTVVAHHQNKPHVGFLFDNDNLGWVHRVRPIRTPEQIAAEEREKVISEMMQLCNKLSCRQSCADLYDAGYRKQEAAQ